MRILLFFSLEWAFFSLTVTSGLDQSFPCVSLQKATGPWAAIRESSVLGQGQALRKLQPRLGAEEFANFNVMKGICHAPLPGY